ncbi:hypothetical protein G7Y89_g6397 [Cudoniella acicularis]|uniref:Heterokaryon incompatibility domain-containing protein n=1 Tax=Cudoniella acicularis TaxID=354080 RepID=A0A8H4W2X1_9HELO|nr:hypothetical protein G7Y89_g6397 [Cudoniella acicularis]
MTGDIAQLKWSTAFTVAVVALSIWICYVALFSRSPKKRESSSQPPTTPLRPPPVPPLRHIDKILSCDILERDPEPIVERDPDWNFVYEPLPENGAIRVLEVLPAKRNDPLTVSFRTIATDKLSQYEAISYCWENQMPTERIICEGKTLKVTRNLSEALKHFRYEDKPRFLWADAACIDQRNTRERTNQVNQMGQIYKNASQVLIWLGQEDEASHGAFRLLHKIWQAYPGPLDWDVMNTGQQDYNFHLEKAAGLESTEWRCLEQLFSRHWFTRSWVFQEIGLACRALVACGELEIDFELLFHVSMILSFQEIGRLQKAPIDMSKGFLAALLRMPWQTKHDQNFLSLLQSTRHLQASDPRDKVFAILSHPAAKFLSSEGTAILPDYSKRTVDIYKAAAVKILRSPSGLALLSVAGTDMDDGRFENLPSWVPNWYTQRHLSTLGGEGSEFSASVGADPEISLSIRQTSLLARGVLFQQCSYIPANPQLIEESFMLLESLSQIEEVSPKDHLVRRPWDKISTRKDYSATYHDGHSSLRAYGLTLAVGGRTVYDHKADDQVYVDFLQYWHPICDPKRRAAVERRIKNLTGKPGNPRRFYETMTRVCAGRTFFLTQKGYYGLGPWGMREGDMVCVLFGAAVPFIIRPQDGPWKLVGEAYVHGIMDGEAIKMWQRNELKDKTFQIG